METITSPQNERIKAAVALRKSAAERRARQQFFLEGARLVLDALASGYAPELLFCTRAACEKLSVASEKMFLVSEAAAQKLAETQHPQGVFGVFAMKPAQPDAQGFRRILALEGVQDPGNLGASARTAEALGLGCLVASGGCDVFHPKALRASMGALLRLPVLAAQDLPAWLRAQPLPTFAAVPDASAVSVRQCDFSQGGVLVVGSEGNGLSQAALAACTTRVTIPMAGRAESLNAAAAAAILMWELVRC